MENAQEKSKLFTKKFSRKIDLKRPGFQIILFLPLIILMAGDLGVLIANEVLIVVNLGISAGQIGYVIGIQYIANGIFTFLFGYLSDKYSRKRLLILGGLVWASGSFLTSLSWDFWSLVFFRLIAAFGIGVQSPVTFSMLSDLFPSEKRSNSFAWWGIANLVGSLFVGGLALSFNTIPTTVLDAEYGSLQEKIDAIAMLYSADCIHWRDPYKLISIIAFIFAGICFLVKEPKRASTEKELRQILANEKVDYSHHYKIRKQDLKFVYKRKTNIFLVLNFFDCVTSGVITAYLLMYITMELGFAINLESINLDLILLLLVVLVALLIALWGQFFFAKLGDKKYNSGDIRGRIKMMTYCGIFMVPFLCAAFAFSPSLGTKSLFKMFVPDGISVSTPVFWVSMLIMMIFLGFGLAGSFGGTPNWYASMIDVNLPEQRGTMIAIASLSDTIGRSVGSIAGGFFLDYFMNQGISSAPIGLMLITVQAIFGGLSILMTFPALFTAPKDLSEVHKILQQRAEDLSKNQSS